MMITSRARRASSRARSASMTRSQASSKSAKIMLSAFPRIASPTRANPSTQLLRHETRRRNTRYAGADDATPPTLHAATHPTTQPARTTRCSSLRLSFFFDHANPVSDPKRDRRDNAITTRRIPLRVWSLHTLWRRERRANREALHDATSTAMRSSTHALASRIVLNAWR